MSAASQASTARPAAPIDEVGAKPEFIAPQPAPSADPNGGLWQAFARSVRDNVFAEIALQIIRVGGMIVLARELTPSDFGVFRVLLIVVAFAVIPIEFGIPEALIQRTQLLPEHESTGWCLSVVVSMLMAALLFLGAPMIARLEMPGIEPYVRLLCIPIILEGTAMVSNARLRREMRFGALASTEVFAEMVFLAAALLLLLGGYPRLSLPGGLAARYVAYSLALWVADRRFATAWPRLWAMRDFSRFTSGVWSARAIYCCSYNADFLLVGHFLGSNALGFYSMAWDLLRFVPDRLFRIAGRVTFPAFSRVQDDNAQLAHAFGEFTAYIARFVLPIMAMAAIAAPEFIAVVYGAKWLPTVLPLRLLSIGFTLMGLRIGIGSVFYSKDHPSYDMWTHGIRLVLIVASVAPLAMYAGLGAISADMAVVEGAVSLIGLALAARLVDTTLMRLLATALPGLRLAIVCGIAAIAGKEIAMAMGVTAAGVLVAEALPALLVFLWMEASIFLDMIGKAFKPAQSQAA
ncbi:MAG TPA: oligosaccharide flippase family protein [Candidatus Binataceae bacterium]|nr:oligosaccharide flippase family protein [Candidatus Binataceae bacterium]